MTNESALRQVIDRSGFKIGFIASEIGLTRSGFYRKLRNETEFKASEIAKLIELLQLSSVEVRDIFLS